MLANLLEEELFAPQEMLSRFLFGSKSGSGSPGVSANSRLSHLGTERHSFYPESAFPVNYSYSLEVDFFLIESPHSG